MSKLNPNAKAFVFNPDAKPFVFNPTPTIPTPIINSNPSTNPPASTNVPSSITHSTVSNTTSQNSSTQYESSDTQETSDSNEISSETNDNNSETTDSNSNGVYDDQVNNEDAYHNNNGMENPNYIPNATWVYDPYTNNYVLVPIAYYPQNYTNPDQIIDPDEANDDVDVIVDEPFIAPPPKRTVTGIKCYDRKQLLDIQTNMNENEFSTVEKILPQQLIRAIGRILNADSTTDNNHSHEIDHSSKSHWHKKQTTTHTDNNTTNHNSSSVESNTNNDSPSADPGDGFTTVTPGKKKKKNKNKIATTVPTNAPVLSKSASKKEEAKAVMESLKAGALASAHKTPARREDWKRKNSHDNIANTNNDDNNYKLHHSDKAWQRSSSANSNELNPLDELSKSMTSILNKLAPEKFDRLIMQTVSLNISTLESLDLIVKLIFDKACDEPNFSALYAQFCAELSPHMPEFIQPEQDNKTQNFRTLLLTRCYTLLVSDSNSLPKINDESELERNERIELQRYRQKGNIVLIGELFKQDMLARSIMHLCIDMLLNNNGNTDEPNEADIESLSLFVTTVGALLDKPENNDSKNSNSNHKSPIMDGHFAKIKLLSKSKSLPSRLRFMLMDLIELRQRNWIARREVTVNPKLIKEIHEEFGITTPIKTNSNIKTSQSTSKKPTISNNSKIAAANSKLPKTATKLTSQDARFANTNGNGSIDKPSPQPLFQRAVSEPMRELSPERTKPNKTNESDNKSIDFNHTSPSKLPGTTPRLTKQLTVATEQSTFNINNSDHLYDISPPIVDHPHPQPSANLIPSVRMPESKAINSIDRKAKQETKRVGFVKLGPQQITKKIEMLIEEYWNAADLVEACLCLEELTGNPPSSSPTLSPVIKPSTSNDTSINTSSPKISNHNTLQPPISSPSIVHINSPLATTIPTNVLSYNSSDTCQQLIYRLVVSSFELQPRHRDLCSKLITSLVVKRYINIYQLLCGLCQVIQILDDLCVDNPHSIKYLSQLLGTAISDHLLSLKHVCLLLNNMLNLTDNADKTGELILSILVNVLNSKEQRFLIKLFIELIHNNGISLFLDLFKFTSSANNEIELINDISKLMENKGLDCLVQYLNNSLLNSTNSDQNILKPDTYSPILRPSTYSPALLPTSKHRYTNGHSNNDDTDGNNLSHIDILPLPASPAKMNENLNQSNSIVKSSRSLFTL